MAKVQKKSRKVNLGEVAADGAVSSEPLVIDKSKNWIFQTEEEVFQHFQDQLTVLEHEYENLRIKEDYAEDYVENFEDVLGEVFEHPDEVWRDEERFEGVPIYTYFKKFPDDNLTYVVLAYLDESIPTFIFMHFPSKDDKMLEAYRRTECVFHVERMAGSGDALSEGDELAMGLFKAMLTVRSETDIPESEFPSYLQFRDETVETADEIWRSNKEEKPTVGLRGVARVYAGWGFSQPFYRDELWRSLGFNSLEDFLVGFWENFWLKRDPDNLLVMLSTW